MTGQTLLLIIAAFAALCLWQFLAGLGKIRRAAAIPSDPQAAMLGRMGKIQMLAGGLMLAVNLLLNLPAIMALL